MSVPAEVTTTNCLNTAQKWGSQFGFEALLSARNEWVSTLSRQHCFRAAMYAGLIVLMEIAVLLKLSIATDPIPFVGVLATFATFVALLVVRRRYMRNHPALMLATLPEAQAATAAAILRNNPWLAEGIEDQNSLTFLELAYLTDMLDAAVMPEIRSFA